MIIVVIFALVHVPVVLVQKSENRQDVLFSNLKLFNGRFDENKKLTEIEHDDEMFLASELLNLGPNFEPTQTPHHRFHKPTLLHPANNHRAWKTRPLPEISRINRSVNKNNEPQSFDNSGHNEKKMPIANEQNNDESLRKTKEEAPRFENIHESYKKTEISGTTRTATKPPLEYNSTDIKNITTEKPKINSEDETQTIPSVIDDQQNIYYNTQVVHTTIEPQELTTQGTDIVTSTDSEKVIQEQGESEVYPVRNLPDQQSAAEMSGPTEDVSVISEQSEQLALVNDTAGKLNNNTETSNSVLSNNNKNKTTSSNFEEIKIQSDTTDVLDNSEKNLDTQNVEKDDENNERFKVQPLQHTAEGIFNNRSDGKNGQTINTSKSPEKQTNDKSENRNTKSFIKDVDSKIDKTLHNKDELDEQNDKSKDNDEPQVTTETINDQDYTPKYSYQDTTQDYINKSISNINNSETSQVKRPSQPPLNENASHDGGEPLETTINPYNDDIILAKHLTNLSFSNSNFDNINTDSSIRGSSTNKYEGGIYQQDKINRFNVTEISVKNSEVSTQKNPDTNYKVPIDNTSVMANSFAIAENNPTTKDNQPIKQTKQEGILIPTEKEFTDQEREIDIRFPGNDELNPLPNPTQDETDTLQKEDVQFLKTESNLKPTFQYPDRPNSEIEPTEKEGLIEPITQKSEARTIPKVIEYYDNSTAKTLNLSQLPDKEMDTPTTQHSKQVEQKQNQTIETTQTLYDGQTQEESFEYYYDDTITPNYDEDQFNPDDSPKNINYAQSEQLPAFEIQKQNQFPSPQSLISSPSNNQNGPTKDTYNTKQNDQVDTHKDNTNLKYESKEYNPSPILGRAGGNYYQDSQIPQRPGRYDLDKLRNRQDLYRATETDTMYRTVLIEDGPGTGQCFCSCNSHQKPIFVSYAEPLFDRPPKRKV